MKTIILNLSDILKVDMNKSIQAFVGLRKKNHQRGGCCGGLFQNHAADLIYVQSNLWWKGYLINQYKRGLITSEQFVRDVLEYHFPCPENYNHEKWTGKLIAAWNKMLEMDEGKIADFLGTISANLDREFILVINSNALQTNYIIGLLGDQEIRFEAAKSDIGFISNSHPNLHLYSSHQMGKFKTDGMIADVLRLNHCDPKETCVCTKYPIDITTAKELGCATMEITSQFDYASIENYTGETAAEKLKFT